MSEWGEDDWENFDGDIDDEPEKPATAGENTTAATTAISATPVTVSAPAATTEAPLAPPVPVLPSYSEGELLPINLTPCHAGFNVDIDAVYQHESDGELYCDDPDYVSDDFLYVLDINDARMKAQQLEIHEFGVHRFKVHMNFVAQANRDSKRIKSFDRTPLTIPHSHRAPLEKAPTTIQNLEIPPIELGHILRRTAHNHRKIFREMVRSGYAPTPEKNEQEEGEKTKTEELPPYDAPEPAPPAQRLDLLKLGTKALTNTVCILTNRRN